jgi:hypothetical protein
MNQRQLGLVKPFSIGIWHDVGYNRVELTSEGPVFCSITRFHALNNEAFEPKFEFVTVNKRRHWWHLPRSWGEHFAFLFVIFVRQKAR